uniref:DNA-primase RepB domain-containing protein n=1 Tax=Scytonema sp. HK-05 TaxID=1137095 RepID=UPI0009361821
WNLDQVLKSVSFLKGMNVNGNDIYIRPAISEGLILLDDIGLGTLQQMDKDGYNPAAIIITSPMNYQAWVRIYQGDFNSEVATQAAKILSERYSSDKNSADWRHYGRLAGFTNLKPVYNRPYVLADRCNGKIATKAEELVLEAHQKVKEAHENTLARVVAQPPLDPSVRADFRHIDPIQYATAQYQRLSKRYANNFDDSKADFIITCDLLRIGITENIIKNTLKKTSPNLETRKIGHIEDYLDRTIAAAHRRLQQSKTK